MKNYLILLLVLAPILQLRAQTDEPEFSGNWISTLTGIRQNAAFAGIQGKLAAQAALRSPTYYIPMPVGLKDNMDFAVVADGQLLKRRLNVGGYASYFGMGAMRIISSSIVANYGLELGENHRLQIGAGIEYQNYSLQLSSYNPFSPYQQVVKSYYTSNSFNYQLGVWYRWKNLQAGVSVWNLGRPVFYRTNETITDSTTKYSSEKCRSPFYLFIAATYFFKVIDFLHISPYINWDLSRIIGTAPFNYTYLESGVQFQITKYAMVGAGYAGFVSSNATKGAIVQLGARFRQFRLYYNLRIPETNPNYAVSLNHEIGFRFLLN